MNSLRKKGNQSYTTLKNIEAIGVKSESDHKLPAVLLTSSLVIFTVLCLSKMFFTSFNTFGYDTIGQYYSIFSKKEVTVFFVKVAIGCIPICIANGMKKYSPLLSVSTFVLYSLYFIKNYREVSNGFIHALNKALLMVLQVDGKYPDVYYVPNYTVTNAKEELLMFCFAAAFGVCFILAFSAVQCSFPFVFTFCVAAVASLPLMLRVLDSEQYFAGAVLCCIVVYVMSIQGYRNIWTGKLVQGFGKIVKIHGSYVSHSAFQQAAWATVCIAVIIAVSSIFMGYSTYKKNPKVVTFGTNILNALNDITGGLIPGESTSNTLSGGDLEKTGNIKYKGEVMFDIKYSRSIENASYLRTFTAAVYDDNSWNSLDNDVYKEYSEMWERFENSGFYPNTMYGDFLSAYPALEDDYNTIKIRHQKLSKKSLLTDTRIFSDSTVLNKTRMNYDEYPQFSAFSNSGKEYEQKFADIQRNDLVFIWGNDDGLAHNFYTMMYNGNFSLAGEDNGFGGMTSVGMPTQEKLDKYLSNEKLYRQFVMENYLQCPDNITDYMPKRFSTLESDYLYEYYGDEDNTLGYSTYIYYQYVIKEVQDYLANHAEYTLSPGVLPGGRDFTEYFINESHEGYCVHFATAGTLMLRYAGIPARYAEGFYVGSNDVDERAGEGYSHIADSNAHAWAEVYFPLIGWQAVEFTPPYNNGNVPQENKSYSTSSSETDTQDDEDTQSDTQEDTQTETDTETNTEIDTETDTEHANDTDSEVSSEEKDVESSASITGLVDKIKRGEGIRLFHLILIVIGYTLYYTLKLVLWLVLRWLCMKLREKRFNEENTRIGVRVLYRHSLFLLRVAGVKSYPNETDEEFARRAMKKIDSTYTTDYLDFTERALNSRFGREPLSREEVDKMVEFVNKLSKKIYDNSGKIKRLVIKYLLFLI